MSPGIKTIEHTATNNIIICGLASRLYVGLMILTVAHISEGVALPKVDHSQLFYHLQSHVSSAHQYYNFPPVRATVSNFQ